MRTFVVFHENYIASSRNLEMIKRLTLQEVLDDKDIDYGSNDNETSALEYLDAYNGDSDHYWMIYEITSNGQFVCLLA